MPLHISQVPVSKSYFQIFIIVNQRSTTWNFFQSKNQIKVVGLIHMLSLIFSNATMSLSNHELFVIGILNSNIYIIAFTDFPVKPDQQVEDFSKNDQFYERLS